MFELLELNAPVVKLKLPRSNVPAVNVVVVVAGTLRVNAPAKVVVPLTQLTVKEAIVLPFVVIVPVPVVVIAKPVYVPALDNVNPYTFKLAATANAVVPKSTVLNQLPELSVCTPVPVPVSVNENPIAADPPVVPYEYTLSTAASHIKPPVVDDPV